MTPDLQKALADWLATLLDAAKSGAALTQDQLPIIIQQKLAFGLWVTALWAGLGVFFLLLSTGLLFYTRKSMLEVKDDYHTRRRMQDWCIVISISLVLVGFPMALLNTSTLLKIYFAPNLYILEWLRGLL